MLSSAFRPNRLLALACTVAATFAIAACGGSSESPSDVALNFYKALSAKDTAKACDYISDEAKKEAASEGGCEKALAKTVSQTKPALLAAFGTLEASDEKINGDKATVVLKPTARGYTSGKETASLVKEDGDWKLVDFNAG